MSTWGIDIILRAFDRFTPAIDCATAAMERLTAIWHAERIRTEQRWLGDLKALLARRVAE